MDPDACNLVHTNVVHTLTSSIFSKIKSSSPEVAPRLDQRHLYINLMLIFCCVFVVVKSYVYTALFSECNLNLILFEMWIFFYRKYFLVMFFEHALNTKQVAIKISFIVCNRKMGISLLFFCFSSRKCKCKIIKIISRWISKLMRGCIKMIRFQQRD